MAALAAIEVEARGGGLLVRQVAFALCVAVPPACAASLVATPIADELLPAAPAKYLAPPLLWPLLRTASRHEIGLGALALVFLVSLGVAMHRRLRGEELLLTGLLSIATTWLGLLLWSRLVPPY